MAKMTHEQKDEKIKELEEKIEEISAQKTQEVPSDCMALLELAIAAVPEGDAQKCRRVCNMINRAIKQLEK